MEYSNSDAPNSTTMPQNHLRRNKLMAAILIPLSIIIMFFSGASILGKLFAPAQLIADEIPLGLRIFHEMLGFFGAVAGVVSAVIALTSSKNVNKFSAAGNHTAAVAASEKASSYGKYLPLLIGMLFILLTIKIAQTFFLEK